MTGEQFAAFVEERLRMHRAWQEAEAERLAEALAAEFEQGATPPIRAHNFRVERPQ